MDDEISIKDLDSFLVDTLDYATFLKPWIERFCRSVKYKNLFDVNYGDPSTLVHCIYKSQRFLKPNGSFIVICNKKKEEIVGITGAERWTEVDPNVALIGRRMMIREDLRSKAIPTRYTLPLQVNWCRDNNIDLALITCNEDRQSIHEAYRRMANGGIYYPGFEYNHVYEGRLRIFDGLYNVKNTPQYLVGYYVNGPVDWEPPKEVKL
jgi:hypothetical protein